MELFSVDWQAEVKRLIVETVTKIVTRALENGKFNKSFELEAMCDKNLALKFDLTERQVGDIRRLMDNLPGWTEYVYGTSTDIEGFRKFLKYRKTLDGKREIKKKIKMKRGA
ncbi:hypothetical protein [Streptococcus himalayensis]|uniref:Uncharacterized protein n=1 Tax=Streptococcus himalayensis TaxID=1888195 RepID=A0A917A530_9STRE|nr:hypothetical protein [Streptococcus himalayensis]QBX25397.1 hypothetical protein Javan254_0042 [Streptococcus phage Javan254]GGE26498.1 hypothetical protein GCM10011510_04630 [Streptococcus himalayensis]